jgi:hypothetical protein
MTIHELYDTSIRQLPVEDRLRLARIILDDAVPEEPGASANEAQQHFEKLVQQGLDSPQVPLTEQVWEQIRTEVRTRAERRSAPHA